MDLEPDIETTAEPSADPLDEVAAEPLQEQPVWEAIDVSDTEPSDPSQSLPLRAWNLGRVEALFMYIHCAHKVPFRGKLSSQRNRLRYQHYHPLFSTSRHPHSST